MEYKRLQTLLTSRATWAAGETKAFKKIQLHSLGPCAASQLHRVKTVSIFTQGLAEDKDKIKAASQVLTQLASTAPRQNLICLARHISKSLECREILYTLRNRSKTKTFSLATADNCMKQERHQVLKQTSLIKREKHLNINARSFSHIS